MKRKGVLVGLVLLAVLHQDFWWWHDPSLLFGFLPVGLAYHALYSVVAGALWYLALTWAWPAEVEQFAEGSEKLAPPEQAS